MGNHNWLVLRDEQMSIATGLGLSTLQIRYIDVFFSTVRGIYILLKHELDRNIPYDLTTGKRKKDINNHKPQVFFQYNLGHQSHLYKQNTSTYLCFHIKNLSFKKHSTPSLSGLYFTLHIRSIFFLNPQLCAAFRLPF